MSIHIVSISYVGQQVNHVGRLRPLQIDAYASNFSPEAMSAVFQRLTESYAVYSIAAVWSAVVVKSEIIQLCLFLDPIICTCVTTDVNRIRTTLTGRRR